ncbi:MAG: murI [Paucimonas sp.]|nr:murI [Paucimonas sp.]
MNNTSDKTPIDASAPIGVFDSGIGGLSVLRHIREQLPNENLIYFADSGFAPYGGKPEEIIVARSIAIADFFVEQKAKAIVVACNTATAASIQAIRERYPSLPVVGVEPGLKPAAAFTKTGCVGVLATERTIASKKFNDLHDQITAATGVRFELQACTGLADQIEKGELQSRETAALLQRYVAPLVKAGADTLVLGCTHYPFVQPLIEDIALRVAGGPVAIVDTGDAVARQLARLIAQHGLLNSCGSGKLQAYASGSESSVAQAFSKLLHLEVNVQGIA